MALTHVLGYPRIGPRRELKSALEAFWRKEANEHHLHTVAATLKVQRWQAQRQAGLDFVAAGDFALYDPMLSQSALLGALPARFGFDASRLTLTQYFELARGNAQQPAMEMTKWFDTNYHYLVPELASGTCFGRGLDTYFGEIAEAQTLGTAVKPILVGPVTWLYLAKSQVPGFDRLTLLPALVEAFAAILRRLHESGSEWVQLDEPALGLDLDARWLTAIDKAYRELARALAGSGPRILMATYFESVADHAAFLSGLPVHGYHIDLVRAPHQLAAWRKALPLEKTLSIGVVDGHNVWRTDLRAALTTLEPLHAELGNRLWVAPSCSLAHVPLSLAHEKTLDDEVRLWLAFADEKLGEVQTLGRALNEGKASVIESLAASDAAVASRRSSRRVHNPLVQQRIADVTPEMAQRHSPFLQRSTAQRAVLNLPPLPTTTVGSFPQTSAIRQLRAAHKRGEIRALDYLNRMRAEVRFVVDKQMDLGLDVLVHGEPERNDMVEYFGEQLWGFAVTENGWVQSYGSRCVKPPIIYGDVYRPEPMTVDTARYAQSLTDKIVKGMLTGPVTLLQWSFVRDDQPREVTATQLALAIRDEVADLEKAGIRIIQVDEPAFREGLPFKARDWAHYLEWAVRAFKLASCPVEDTTQIHTHMCYSKFNDILPSIAALDADVITIETSRSKMELLDGFGDFKYSNEIGPGIYDIHSPRVPSAEDMLALLRRAAEVIPPERLWVNPDCGLKTRGWPETEAALHNMVEAARCMRGQLHGP
jgi:5-methyltetrahydropteroyltriglutamate--homocysteine methyltransferase